MPARRFCAQLSLQVQLHQPPAQWSPRWLSVLWSPVTGVNHALTCHSTSDSLVLAANRDCLQHRGRPSSARRNSDGPRFHTQNDDSGDSLFRVGSTPERPGSLRWDSDVSLSERSDVTQLHVSGKLRTIWPSLHRMCCSVQNSLSRAHLMRHGRLHSLRTLLTMLEQHCTSKLECAQAGVGACPFLRGLCGSILASLGRELVQVLLRFLLSVGGVFLKKSASVVAEDSARMVTFVTCFSITSVFSRVSLMASLWIVSASVASWHFCSHKRLVSVCHTHVLE